MPPVQRSCAADQDLDFIVEHNPDKLVISCQGKAAPVRLLLKPHAISLGPLLPSSPGQAPAMAELLLENPGGDPIEV